MKASLTRAVAAAEQHVTEESRATARWIDDLERWGVAWDDRYEEE